MKQICIWKSDSILVCGRFADKLYDSCSPFEIQISNSQCKLIGSNWKNGKDFIENVFDNVYAKDNTQCFNTAEITKPTLTYLLIGITSFIIKFLLWKTV